jgi:acetyltransferase-like isoleucine patch superfamily enzyme
MLFRLRQKMLWVNAGLRAQRLAALTPGLQVDRHTRVWRNATISIEPGGRIRLRGTHVREFVSLEAGPEGALIIGSARISRFTTIAARTSVSIGDDVSIGNHCSIRDHDHEWSPESGVSATRWVASPVVIGDRSWLGAQVIILRGRRIGSRSLVAGGAVVTRDVPAGTIAIGVPARIMPR